MPKCDRCGRHASELYYNSGGPKQCHRCLDADTSKIVGCVFVLIIGAVVVAGGANAIYWFFCT